MKRFSAICVAIAAVLAGGPVQSQTNNVAPPMGQGRPQGMTSEDRLNRLSEVLNLNEEQKAKVEATFEETRQKVQAAIIEARSNAEAQLQQILTPEQYHKLQAYWAHPEHHGMGGGANTNQNSGQ